MPLDLFTRLDPLRRVRCPYCFEQFAALDLHVQCESQVCQDDFGRQVEDPILTRAFFGPQAESALRGPWWTDPRRDPRRGRRRYLDWLLLPDALTCPHCNEPTSCRLCPKCHHRLPIDALFQQSGHIAIFGPQSVGKTTYLTVVLHEFDYNVGPDRGLLLDPIDDDIRQR